MIRAGSQFGACIRGLRLGNPDRTAGGRARPHVITISAGEYESDDTVGRTVAARYEEDAHD